MSDRCRRAAGDSRPPRAGQSMASGYIWPISTERQICFWKVQIEVQAVWECVCVCVCWLLAWMGLQVSLINSTSKTVNMPRQQTPTWQFTWKRCSRHLSSVRRRGQLDSWTAGATHLPTHSSVRSPFKQKQDYKQSTQNQRTLTTLTRSRLKMLQLALWTQILVGKNNQAQLLARTPSFNSISRSLSLSLSFSLSLPFSRWGGT